MTQPNLPYSESSILSRTLHPSLPQRLQQLRPGFDPIVDHEGRLAWRCGMKDATSSHKMDDSEYGKFGWVHGFPRGNKVELWQPPAGRQMSSIASKNRHQVREEAMTIPAYIPRRFRARANHTCAGCYAIIKSVAPRAQQEIKWGIRASSSRASCFAFAAHKSHLRLCADGGGAGKIPRAELKGHRTTKNFLNVPYDEPLPEALIRKIARSQSAHGARPAKTTLSGNARRRGPVNSRAQTAAPIPATRACAGARAHESAEPAPESLPRCLPAGANQFRPAARARFACAEPGCAAPTSARIWPAFVQKVAASAAAARSAAASVPRISYPESLPIAASREEIRRAIEQHPVLILLR